MTGPTVLTLNINDLPSAEGEAFGPSEWRTVTADDVAMFAKVTGDDNPIHVDQAYAQSTPFGTRIAHGLFTLSLVVPLMADIFAVPDAGMGINYGLNKVRFPAPVPVDARIRVTGQVGAVTEIAGGHQLEVPVIFEVEGSQKPACVAELVLRYYR